MYHILAIHLSVNGLSSCFCFLVIVSRVATNIGIQTSLSFDIKFSNTFPHIIELDHMVVLFLVILRKFQSNCITLHSQIKYISIPLSPYLYHHLLSFLFLILTTPIGKVRVWKWFLIYIFLIAKDIEQNCKCFLVISSFENSPFNFTAKFYLGYLGFSVQFWNLYIFWALTMQDG